MKICETEKISRRPKAGEGIQDLALPGNSEQPDALNRQAVQAAREGRLDLAVRLLSRAIVLRPNLADYHLNLGEFYRRLKQYPQAIASCKTAVALNSTSVGAHFNLGTALKDAGQYEAALAQLSEAIRLDPSLSPAQNNLGIALRHLERPTEAIAAFENAIRLRPDYFGSFNNLGLALRDAGRLEDAAAAHSQAIRLKPDSSESHLNLSTVLIELNRPADAVASVRKAIQLNPQCGGAYSNLGNALSHSGDFHGALDAYRAAVRLDPTDAESHWNLGLCLLAGGNFADGWAEYEWRTRCKKQFNVEVFLPRWAGESLVGKSIFIHSEQGFGDAIQFARYCQLVAGLGGRVVLECPGELRRLFTTLPGVSQLVSRGEPVPLCDVHCPLLSLPLMLGTRLETIPADVPYLMAEPALQSQWSRRLATLETRPKIGLAWAGNRTHVNDRRRSIPADQLSPLTIAAHKHRFISLQKDNHAKLSTDLPLIDWTSDLRDFADTAALIANLDLVITVDTAVAHLAGALGKPVWLLLSFPAEWRWLRKRDDSPWYPTMRLFRQAKAFEWREVLERIAAELNDMTT